MRFRKNDFLAQIVSNSVALYGNVDFLQANGELYYLASLSMLLLIIFIKPQVCVSIYQNMGAILGGLNVVALSLCLFLFVKAKLKIEEEDPYLRNNV